MAFFHALKAGIRVLLGNPNTVERRMVASRTISQRVVSLLRILEKVNPSLLLLLHPYFFAQLVGSLGHLHEDTCVLFVQRRKQFGKGLLIRHCLNGMRRRKVGEIQKRVNVNGLDRLHRFHVSHVRALIQVLNPVRQAHGDFVAKVGCQLQEDALGSQALSQSTPLDAAFVARRMVGGAAPKVATSPTGLHEHLQRRRRGLLARMLGDDRLDLGGNLIVPNGITATAAAADCGKAPTTAAIANNNIVCGAAPCSAVTPANTAGPLVRSCNNRSFPKA